MKPIIAGIALLLAVVGAAQGAQDGSLVIKIALLNQDPNPAPAGGTVDIRFRVENTGGGVAENLEMEILPDYPFTVIDGPALQVLGTLYAYQTEKNHINAQYKLKTDKDAVKGQHELRARYRYGNQDWRTSIFTIDVTSHEFAQIIYVDKARLEPGKETEMKFTITNIGSAPLKDLVFSWSELDGVILPVFSDDTKYVKYLDMGDSAELKYTVIADVNADPGLYQLDLRLTYDSLANATPTAITTRTGVFVGGETDFYVAFSESTQGQTSLSVANTGNTPALSVAVRIPEQPGFRVTGSNSAIIGNLDKGDYTLVSFQIVNSAAQNFTGQSRRGQFNSSAMDQMAHAGLDRNSLRVIIDYTDTTGERRSVEKTVPIQFRAIAAGSSASFGHMGQQQSGLWQNRAWIAAGAVLLALVGIIAYRRARKRRLARTATKP